MTPRHSALVPIFLGSMFGALYLYTLTEGVTSGVLSPNTPLQQLVVGTMIVRLVVIIAVPSIRESSTMGFDIMAAEIVALPAMVFFHLATGDPTSLELSHQLIDAWPVASLMVFPPFAIYRVLKAAAVGAPLRLVLPGSAGVLVLLAVFDEVVGSTPAGTFLSLAGLGVVSRLSVGGLPSAPLEVTAVGVGVYLAMVLYVVLGRPGTLTRPDAAIAVAIVGTLGAAAWASTIGALVGSAQLVLSIPAVGTTALVWWVARGK